MTLLRLPEEILLMILGFLKEESDIKQCTLVSRRMYETTIEHLRKAHIMSGGIVVPRWSSFRGQEATLFKSIQLDANANINKPVRSLISYSGDPWILYSPRSCGPLAIEAFYTSDSATCLHLAARDGRVGMLRRLITAGADVEARDEHSWSPVLLAMANGHLEAAMILLRNIPGESHGANHLVIADHHMTALHLACYLGQAGVIGYLLAMGANVNALDSFGLFPLDYWMRTSELLQALFKTIGNHCTLAPRFTVACLENADHVDIILMLEEAGAQRRSVR
ncbi:uncharacterized protein L3040_007975 [Drepanopeziza brunnea f. sp. 'multigermtubi']|uniref:uncharacterized protein n=1 Tax=Drepanopeziza brunnea f. sp. 'multigermtubi' TaxID=698441 RepID=UPI0023A34CE8|nr:hypothetical protein L3040_007975 [Drepanopeziza brunnea f. sp. 'multigermtubi']